MIENKRIELLGKIICSLNIIFDIFLKLYLNETVINLETVDNGF